MQLGYGTAKKCKLKKANKNNILVIVVLTLSAWLAWRLLFDNETYKWIPRKFRHYYQFGFLFFTFLVGYLGLRKNDLKWIKTIWVIVYGTLVTLLVAMGLVDRFLYPLSLEMRVGIAGIRDFFLTPLPYLILWLFSAVLKPMANNK